MKLTCPRNPAHKVFEGNALVYEAWLVDENAEWFDTLDGVAGDVAREPETFTCATCAEEGNDDVSALQTG